jgi:hypothetical protein
MGVVAAGSTASLTDMTVNTPYRVERRVSATSRALPCCRVGSPAWCRGIGSVPRSRCPQASPW